MSDPTHPEATSRRIIQAGSPEEISQARELFREYGATPDFCVCFKGFEEEVQSLPGIYAPPGGRLLLADVEGEAAGCIGFRKLEPGVCEIRRLYVRPHYRSKPDSDKSNNYGEPSYQQQKEYKDSSVLPTYKYDYDSDGAPNRLDKDDDNDGVYDQYDKSPYNPQEY